MHGFVVARGQTTVQEVSEQGLSLLQADTVGTSTCLAVPALGPHDPDNMQGDHTMLRDPIRLPVTANATSNVLKTFLLYDWLRGPGNKRPSEETQSPGTPHETQKP